MRLTWRGAARLVRTVLGAERLCRAWAAPVGERRTGERAAASARAWSKSIVATGGAAAAAAAAVAAAGAATVGVAQPAADDAV